MVATRRNSQVCPKVVKKLSEHQIIYAERKFSHNKFVKYLKRIKEPKIHSGILKNNKTQVDFKNPCPEKEKYLS
jgi:hypothetical protein